MPIVNSNDYQFVFSLNKQNNFRTPVADSALKYCRSARNFAPVTEVPQNITDRAWYGKGHSFSTFVDRITHMYSVPAQERSASELETLFAAAMVMGKVVTTQPDSGNDQYQHVVTFNPTSTVKEVQYTTLGEVMGSEYKSVVSGVWINQFTLTGNRADHVVLSYEGGARKIETGDFTTPAISATSFYKTLYGTMKFGSTGASVLVSPDVLNWTITLNQNAAPMFLMGNSVGEEMLLSKVLIGKQSVNASFVVFVDKTKYMDIFRNDTQCEMEIVAASPDLCCVGGSRKQVKITIPEVKIIGEAFGLEGDTVAYTMNLGEEGVLKTGATEPITLTFQSSIDDTELLVAA